jgi:hypothetical protein
MSTEIHHQPSSAELIPQRGEYHDSEPEYKDARGRKINVGDEVRLSEAGRNHYVNDPKWLKMNQPEEGYEDVVDEQAKEDTLTQYRGEVTGFSENDEIYVLNFNFRTDDGKPTQFGDLSDEIPPEYLVIH